MLRRPGRVLLVAAVVLVAILVGGSALTDLYTDALWYSGLGYGSVYWTRIAAGFGVRIATGGLGAAFVALNLWFVARQLGPVQLRRRYGNLEISEQIPRRYVSLGLLAAALLAGWWLSGISFDAEGALAVLAWLRHVEWGTTDPLLGRDLSFYVFDLPIYYRIGEYLLLLLVWTFLLVLLGYVLSGGVRLRDGRLEIESAPRLHFVVLVAGMALLIGARYWLGRYGLLVEGSGVRYPLGHTDVTARLPARTAMAFLSCVAAAALLFGAWRRTWLPALLSVGALLLGALLAGFLYPALVQKFAVEPNQFAREAPYIRWNIEFTRRAYDLHRIERRPHPYRPTAVPPWEELEPVLAALPLWDPEPLRIAYNQIQTIFPYYQFPGVDYDRYGTPAASTQVAIAVREFYARGLPTGAQTWQTLRLNPRYIAGLGAVITPASQVSGRGEPVLWLGNLDPVVRDAAAPPSLELTHPQIFVGETTSDYVVLVPGRDGALNGTPGKDFPEGIPLRPFPRLLAFAWRFADKNLLFSGELNADSRILFRRSVGERVRAIAPFLLWDPDPYPVIHHGRIVWIVDGYTASETFPLSRPLSRSVRIPGLESVRYLRNSAKATVDALTGAVSLFTIDDADPIMETYRRVFPGLLKPLDAMDPGLRAHLRYPALYLRAQAAILEEYHIDGAEAFYAGQDVWQVPEELGTDARSFRPTYSILRLPGEERPEFVLSVPFIARQRQNMTAILLARNDPPHYGELLLLELPRNQQVPGPTQIETLIEQDPAISYDLSIWRNSGSNVDLGRLRVVPLDSTFLYIEPLFLSGQGTPIPELQRVIVSDGRAVSMALTLPEAIAALRGGGDGAPVADAEASPTDAGGADDWPRRALDLLERADRRLREGDLAGFGAALRDLREFLQRVARREPAG
ncbi:MAG TPA: UPF0182 family protein [Longimicrobiales bacterium]